MKRMMELAIKTGGSEGAYMSLLIEEAFGHPRYSTKSIQRGTILDFKNKQYRQYYQSVK